MKITAIKPFPIWVGNRNQLVVKLETDEGIHGLGESGLSGREQAVVGALRHFERFLLGKDPRRIEALWQEMYRSQYFEGGRALAAAISALDIALHDLLAKSLDVPLYQLLGGKCRDYVECFATIAFQGDVQALIDGVRQLADDGWKAIRVVAGRGRLKDGQETVFEPRRSLGETAEALIALREAVGSRPTLGVEFHHRLSVAEAASFCQRLPSGTLDFLEEPIRDECPEAYESLRRMTDIPFAIGEEFASKWAFLPYIERGILQFARLDICNAGGYTESRKIAGLAEAHYIDLMPHNPLGPICAAASLHLGLATPNFSWLEMRQSAAENLGAFDSPLFAMDHRLDGPRLVPADTPGLGVSFDDDAAADLPFEFWEPPHLRREDGSYTNW